MVLKRVMISRINGSLQHLGWQGVMPSKSSSFPDMWWEEPDSNLQVPTCPHSGAAEAQSSTPAKLKSFQTEAREVNGATGAEEVMRGGLTMEAAATEVGNKGGASVDARVAFDEEEAAAAAVLVN